MTTIACPDCTFANPFFKQRCEVCFRHLHQPEWRCKQCEFSNPVTNLKCSKCGKARSDSIKRRPRSVERKKDVTKQPGANLLDVGAAVDCGRRPRSSDNRVDKRWPCCQCTFMNDSDNNSCDMCVHVKGQCCVVPQGIQWKCQGCDNYNHDSFTRCTFCSKKRPAPVPPPKPKAPKRVAIKGQEEDKKAPPQSNDQLWHCKFCSFKNASSLFSCEMCSHNKPGLGRKSAGKERKKPDLRMSVKSKNLRTIKTRQVEREWRNIVMNCQQNNTNYVDPTFPPNDNSLFKNPRPGGSNVQWMRVKDVCDRDGKGPIKWKVYDKPSADDIMQGSIGNCWFICALAVVAERQKLVERIVVTKDYCPEGAYVVRLCKNGTWKTLVVDDYFPVDQHKRLKYSMGKRGQLWVPLIEKAAAKIHGCYEALTSGLTVESLSLLTGEPCEHVSLNENKDLSKTISNVLMWSKLTHARDCRYLMCTSCEAKDGYTPEYCKSLGLITGHAYSLLDICDLETGEKLLKIRNPWGTDSWKGDWSDSSPKWRGVKPEVKKKLQPDGNKHGVFWMEFQDFKKYFRSVDICKTRDWHETRIKGSFPTTASGPWKIAKIYVKQVTDLCIGLNQQNRRGNNKGDEMSDMAIIVMETLKDGKLRIVGNSKRDIKSYVGCDIERLASGEYIIACLAVRHLTRAIHAKFQLDFVLTIHSTNNIIVEETDSVTAGFTHFLADVLIQSAVQNGDGKNYQWNTKVYNYSWDGVVYVVENKGKQNEFIEFQMDCSKCSNLATTRQDTFTQDVIPPGHRQLILLMSSIKPTGGWRSSIQNSYIKGNKPGLEHFAKDKSKKHIPDIPRELLCLHEPRPIK